jgi:hypothetical protein
LQVKLDLFHAQQRYSDTFRNGLSHPRYAEARSALSAAFKDDTGCVRGKAELGERLASFMKNKRFTEVGSNSVD